MKDSAIVQSSIELLQLIFTENQPADHMARQYFNARRYIGSKDRKKISENVFQVLRFKMSLAWWAEKVLGTSPRALILTFLFFKKGYSIAEIAKLFSDDPYGPKSLSQIEWAYLEKLQGKDYYDVDMPLYARWDVPQWSVNLLKDVFGETIENEMAAMLVNAPLDVRINQLKVNNTAIENFFRSNNIAFEKLDGTEHAYRIPRGTALSQTDCFKAGCIEVQDLGSQMIIDACGVEPGMQVLDYCAGAGGKTLGLAAKMMGKGSIIACDISSNRLKQCKIRLKRAGVQNTQLRQLDSQGIQWLKRQKGRFDRILADVPCSGSGTWRRNPDLKWRMPEEDVKGISLIQKEILQKIAPLVKKGGWLIYSTCSLLEQENEKQVSEFINYNPGFVLKEQTRLSPCSTGTDGFYYAILIRR